MNERAEAAIACVAIACVRALSKVPAAAAADNQAEATFWRARATAWSNQAFAIATTGECPVMQGALR